MPTSVPLECPWEAAWEGWSVTQFQQQALFKNFPFQTFPLLAKYLPFIICISIRIMLIIFQKMSDTILLLKHVHLKWNVV